MTEGEDIRSLQESLNRTPFQGEEYYDLCYAHLFYRLECKNIRCFNRCKVGLELRGEESDGQRIVETANAQNETLMATVCLSCGGRLDSKRIKLAGIYSQEFNSTRREYDGMETYTRKGGLVPKKKSKEQMTAKDVYEDLKVKVRLHLGQFQVSDAFTEQVLCLADYYIQYSVDVSPSHLNVFTLWVFELAYQKQVAVLTPPMKSEFWKQLNGRYTKTKLDIPVLYDSCDTLGKLFVQIFHLFRPKGDLLPSLRMAIINAYGDRSRNEYFVSRREPTKMEEDAIMNDSFHDHFLAFREVFKNSPQLAVEWRMTKWVVILIFHIYNDKLVSLKSELARHDPCFINDPHYNDTIFESTPMDDDKKLLLQRFIYGTVIPCLRCFNKDWQEFLWPTSEGGQGAPI